MNIEEEIAAELRDTFNMCGDDPGCLCEYAMERSERVARHVLMTLVRRAQAEAIRDAAQRNRGADQGVRLPPAMFADWLDEEADRIEQEAGDVHHAN